MSVTAQGRGRVVEVVRLYGSPRRLWAMVHKAVRVLAEHGARELMHRVHRKLKRPGLPLDLLGRAAERRLVFENRWVQSGAGLCSSHSVTVIILTKGNQALLDTCLGSLARSVDSSALVDILVVTNGGPVRPPEPYPFPVRILTESRPFNWSAYNNRAVAVAQGEFLLFLNDDVEALHGGWLDAMIASALSPGVGVVGAKLLFPEGVIQHWGVELGLGGEAGHRHKFEERDSGKDRSTLIEAVDAVTGACLLTSRALSQELGGFDVCFPLNYNDVDYCLRSAQAGWRVVVCSEAELLHLETATRSFGVSAEERRRFQRRWRTVLEAKGRQDRGPSPTRQPGL